MRTTVRELKWGDDPKIRTALEAVRPKGAVQTPKSQYTPREMLFAGMDIIFQAKRERRRLRQDVEPAAFGG